MLGVDYSQGYDLNSLKSPGVGFACRYVGFTDYSLPQQKILTYSESYDLASIGMPIVSNFEWTGDRASINNSFYNGNSSLAFSGGVSDAKTAESVHKSCGGPHDKPIYFSVDFDTDGTDCVDYFNGIVSVMGINRVGVYGPYKAVLFLSSKGLVRWVWQTYAWSNGAWVNNANIQQYNNGVLMGKMVVDFNRSMTSDFGQWTLPKDAPKPVWYQYPIGVPFGNSNYDVGLGGSHDATVLAPPNMPVTSIVHGTISDISGPSWGKQVGIKLDTPVQGHGWFHKLHLSATNPALSVGQAVDNGTLLGWVGGATQPSQYNGTSNPTGSNFLDSPDMSSQVQVGIALSDGPAYGGIGWKNFPPIDPSLDPTPILQQARNSFMVVHTPNPNKVKQFNDVWYSAEFANPTGIHDALLQAFLSGFIPAVFPLKQEDKNPNEQTLQINNNGELLTTDWEGATILWQSLSNGYHIEWYPSNGMYYIYDQRGSKIL